MVSEQDKPEERTLTHEERQELRALLIGENACNALKFQTVAVRRLGPAAGIFVRQLLFWEGRGMDPDGWIYKSINQWKQETGLARRQQERARRILLGKGLMQEKLALSPDRRRTLFFLLDLEALLELLGKDLLPPPTPDPYDSEGGSAREYLQTHEDVDAEPSTEPGSNASGISEQCPLPAISEHGPPAVSSEQVLAPGISGHAIQKRTTKSTAPEEPRKSSPAGDADASTSRAAPPSDQQPMKVQEAVALAVSLCEEFGRVMGREEREILGRNLAALGLENVSRERATLAIEQYVEEVASSPQQAVLTSPERWDLRELLENPNSRTGALASAYRATEGLFKSPIGIRHIAEVAKLELGLEDVTADALVPITERLISRVRQHIGPLATAHAFTATGADVALDDGEQSPEAGSRPPRLGT